MFSFNCGIKTTLHHFEKLVYCNNVLRLCNTAVKDDLIQWNKLKLKYSDKQLNSALKILKEGDTKKMKKYKFPEMNKKGLESGSSIKQFESLDEFISLSLLKVDDIDNFCSIIATQESKSPKKTKICNLVTPSINKDELKNIKTTVGLRLGLNYISWSQLTLTGSNCNLSNWHCQSISDLPLSTNPIEMIHLALEIGDKIPDADVFIMEKDGSKPMATLKSSLVKLMMRQQQLTSVILTLLTMRKNQIVNEKLVNSIFMMKPFTSAKLFGLYLGNEVVTGNDVVQKLFREENVGLKNVSSITVYDEFQHYYRSLNNYEREELNKNLLLTLAFFETVVLEKNL